jgi:RNA polymerase sigma factor (sigma-70 family)
MSPLWGRAPELRRGRDAGRLRVPLQALGAWLHTVAARVCISHLRRERLLDRLQGLWFGAKTTQATDTLFENHEEAALAMAAIAKLPPRERVTFCMYSLEGKRLREIAASLSMSEGYVSKLLTRARTALRANGWEADDA